VAEELEAAAADSAPHLVGGRRGPAPAPGTRCANCGAVLEGRYCHVCGQAADTHKRSILHLIWEGIEGLLHLDGRLLRTLPDLFLRPGRLARDYMEGRIARHVPPFRTFLVALLLFIFAAEHAVHEMTRASERQAQAHAALLATPAGRASEVARIRAEADRDHAHDLAEAARDRAEDLREGDDAPADVQARYANAVARVNASYADTQGQANRVAQGHPEDKPTEAGPIVEVKGSHKSRAAFSAGIHKARANPEYYLTVLFTWGHRLAILLLPIIGLSLAAVYRNKHRYFIYDHLLVAMDLLSFAFLANAVGLVLPWPWMGYWLAAVAVWTPINLFQTLRGGYGSSVLGALLKTLVVWMTSVVAFGMLVVGLVIFSLTQI
jgi:hypothetical protein